ncbi:hypothetical protein [Bradyrhizobium elkanii]|uniref:Uncharacterized protein n=1 Tax=Bradyrhizobium elkanii TaxID=29448 RepID=A0ABV4EU31_BRAEL|nr:hypothetical protein [Bradyrhizobium elkanii]MCP1755650.1 hypothetical protein [Bradyrhizobium elkanii]MCP1981166.1 hypothetical protein [Bradyrhizobium elkanii]MCS3884056.1 hypothetical protein [Bradyrhizobium elkanii]MCS4216916.1 hypothetical protein [Bradyrhizobium elkanii]MCW2196643.1 hypothetical protein [Bradyrhizobium elkanii]
MKEVPAPHIQYDEQTTGQEQFEKAFDIIFEEVLRRRRHSTPTDSTPIGEHWFTRGSMRHSNVGCGRFTARLIRRHCWHRRVTLKMSWQA